MSALVENTLLSVLSRETRQSIMSCATAVHLPIQTALYRVDWTPSYAYFLTSGIASVVTQMSNGETAEVGFIGREGVVGGLHLLGPALLSTNCVMQLEGDGLRIPLAVLQRIFQTSEEARNRILEFVQEQAATLGQVAGCNRLHSAGQRLIRWLLQAQDLTQNSVLNFTQEYLGEMIGTQRTTVTVIAGELQGRGLISYSRGRFTVVDRVGLETAACECYAAGNEAFERRRMPKP